MASKVLKSKIAVYAQMNEPLAASLASSLEDDAIQLEMFSTPDALLNGIDAHQDDIDCLVLEAGRDIAELLEQLQSRFTPLPTILIRQDASQAEEPLDLAGHPALFWLDYRQIEQISAFVDAVISQFLKITVDQAPSPATVIDINEQARIQLTERQRRLAEKLRERLGYLGVYYKRDSASFLRNLSGDEKKRFLSELKQSYRDIILNYFTDDPRLNQKIDNYINSAFFADVPVVQIVELHMDMMEVFSKQLKLEGRSDEILLDYRLTLIDTLSNLCEMYRRSIPREP